MGASSSKPMKKYEFDKKSVDVLNLREKELRCTKKELEYRESLKQQIAGWSERHRVRLLNPVNNDAESEYKFKPITVPLDAEGYCQAFSVDKKQAISDFFSVYGFVVVRDCLNEEACAESVAEVWDFIERHTKGVDRTDNTTWNSWMSLATLGYLGTSSVLSPQFAANRTNEKVYAAFRTILQEEDLYVNVGGAGCMRPTVQVPFRSADLRKLRKDGIGLHDTLDGAVTDNALVPVDRPDWRTKEGRDWLHWDMNPFTGAVSSFNWAVQDADKNREYRLRVQGFLALTDCARDNGGFFCVPGAHKVIRKWAKHHAEDPALRNRVLEPLGNTLYYIPANDPMRDAGQEIPVRAGSLLIWNSALPHSSYPNRSNQFRMVQYVKMTSAKAGDFEPLHKDIGLLRPSPTFLFSELGKRLHGFEPWVALEAHSNSGEDESVEEVAPYRQAYPTGDFVDDDVLDAA